MANANCKYFLLHLESINQNGQYLYHSGSITFDGEPYISGEGGFQLLLLHLYLLLSIISVWIIKRQYRFKYIILYVN